MSKKEDCRHVHPFTPICLTFLTFKHTSLCLLSSQFNILRLAPSCDEPSCFRYAKQIYMHFNLNLDLIDQFILVMAHPMFIFHRKVHLTPSHRKQTNTQAYTLELYGLVVGHMMTNILQLLLGTKRYDNSASAQSYVRRKLRYFSKT